VEHETSFVQQLDVKLVCGRQLHGTCIRVSFALISQGSAINIIAAEHKTVIQNSPELTADYAGNIQLIYSLRSCISLTMARNNNNINVFVIGFV
jgi:hypothetical protein